MGGCLETTGAVEMVLTLGGQGEVRNSVTEQILFLMISGVKSFNYFC